MTPIQDLLHRIRWDKEFGRGEFAVGYYDRLERGLILVPFSEIVFPKDSPGVFELTDREGTARTIPLHRVKAVYKNGELIWHREYGRPAPSPGAPRDRPQILVARPFCFDSLPLLPARRHNDESARRTVKPTRLEH